MSQIQTVETIILDTIKNEFQNFDVESFPVDFSNYHFTSSLGCILVKFNSAEFNEQNTIWNVNQDYTLSFDIISGYRGLTTYNEVYPLQQNLKNILQGLEILGRKITLKKEEIFKEVNTDIFCKITCKIYLTSEETENEE